MAIHSGGEIVAITSELGWVERLVIGHVGASETPADSGGASVRVHIEATTKPFGSAGMRVITRGAHGRAGETIMANAGGSGFDVRVTIDGPVLDVVARYRPPLKERLANNTLGDRFGLLASQILVHYPVLWRAGWRGRVPLHASVLRTSGGTPLLAGPGGVGKSRLVGSAIEAGALATADNLCCADVTDCYGIAEPLRMHHVDMPGARTSNGRVSVPFGRRERVLAPDRLIVLERTAATDRTTTTDRTATTETTAARIDPADAARALVAGTYAAGELRRYWAYAATLALATGRGPAHPPIGDIAIALAERMPCVRVRVGEGDQISADRLCDPGEATAAARRSAREGVAP